MKPNSSKIAHFPIKNYFGLHFTITSQNHFFPTIPQTYFATKFRTTFKLIEVFTDKKPDICGTIIQNTSKHVATLPTGHIGYIEVPITNEKPKFYQVNDINTLIHNVTHTYHPEITEQVQQTNYTLPIQYRHKLNTFLEELEKYNTIKQIGSSPQDKPVYGTTYSNPLIIIRKGDTTKCVLDARHLNSNTEQSDESWPIEPLAPQLARANKKYKCSIDLMYAYAHTPLDEETIKLTSFSSGDKLFAFIRGFYDLKGLPKFFSKQLSTFFKTLIEQGFALVYLDDILLLSNSKEHTFQLIEQLHIISTKNNLKLAPEKSFFMFLKVKFLGHEIGYNTIKPIHSKIAAIHKIPSPTGKVNLMCFIGALNFYPKFIKKLHISLKPFYDLLQENTPWK